MKISRYKSLIVFIWIAMVSDGFDEDFHFLAEDK